VTDSTPTQDPGYLAAVTDLLGLLAYAELIAFFHMSEDAALAASIADKAALAQMAVTEFGHFDLVRGRLVELGADPERAMSPFMAPLDAFHTKTAPSSWTEGLVKAYVGGGIAADFYRAIAELLDPQTRGLVLEVLADYDHGDFVVGRVRAAIDADPPLAGRLALWARRLVGEALSQAQRVAAEHEPLARLIAGRVCEQAAPDGGPASARSSELGDIGRMFARLTDQHSRRLSALGLSA
jgi:tRNA-(MS[2]IO[6]A)-hydroxylase (MiaE)-like